MNRLQSELVHHTFGEQKQACIHPPSTARAATAKCDHVNLVPRPTAPSRLHFLHTPTSKHRLARTIIKDQIYGPYDDPRVAAHDNLDTLRFKFQRGDIHQTGRVDKQARSGCMCAGILAYTISFQLIVLCSALISGSFASNYFWCASFVVRFFAV